MNHITMVHSDNFRRRLLGALELLNAFAEYRLESIFPNLSVSFRMSLIAPVTVAAASISKLMLNLSI